MTSEEILTIIADNFLTVRRLPFKSISHWTYREGDENLKYSDTETTIRTVITQDFDLEHFKNTPPPKYSSNLTPEQRYEQFKKIHPKGRKLLREERTVKNGGWYYITQTGTSATVYFDGKGEDVFKAQTLEEAIKLFLNSKP